jgi:hypothetical protein
MVHNIAFRVVKYFAKREPANSILQTNGNYPFDIGSYTC